MQFIQKCQQGVAVGCLAQFDDQGTITERTTGRAIGVISKVFDIEEIHNDVSIVVPVAEITMGGWSVATLSGGASKMGCDLFASGSRLSATGTGSPIARLVPRTLGEEYIDFVDGDLVTVFLL